jgi:EAL domain-containing protein (putative c-di-GMP-specific phosphodiesterase class I)
VRLIQPFHVDTVAEYVETEAVAQRLRLMGIDYGQGYVFGKPEPTVGALQTLKLDESDRLRKLLLET